MNVFTDRSTDVYLWCDFLFYIVSMTSFIKTVLPQLPLPTPLPQTVQNKSLLYSPNIIDGARQLLASADENLGSQIAQALRQTNTTQM